MTTPTPPVWTTQFVVPSNLKYGDPSFNLTNPVSNSSGAFTYSINNTNIASINGNTVYILGAGTTSITAFQDASGIYTSKSVSLLFVVNAIPPTLSNFIIPKKEFNDGSFNLTDPSSNSTGLITYVSSNPSVAIISGRAVSIRGIGSSVITATQSAYGNYTAGVISSQLTVITSIVRIGVQNQIDLSWNVPVNNGSIIKNYFFYSEERTSSSITSTPIASSYDSYLLPVPYSASFLSSSLLPSGFDVNEQNNTVILTPAVELSTTNYFDMSYNAEIELSWKYHGDRPILDICSNSVSQTTMTLTLYKRNSETNDRIDLLRSYERTYDSFTNRMGAIPQNNNKIMKDVFNVIFDQDVSRNLLYMKKNDIIEGTIEFSDLYYHPSTAAAITDQYKQKYSIIVLGVSVMPYRIPFSQEFPNANVEVGSTVYYTPKLTRPLTHFNEAKMMISWNYNIDISNAIAKSPGYLPIPISDFNTEIELRIRCFSRSFKTIYSTITDSSYNTLSADQFINNVRDPSFNTYMLFDVSQNYTVRFFDITPDETTNLLPVISTTFDLSGVMASTFPASKETNDPAHTQFVYVFTLSVPDPSYNHVFQTTPFYLNALSHTFIPRSIYRFSGPDPTLTSSNILTSPTKTVYNIDKPYYNEITPFYRFYNLTNGNYYSYRIASNNLAGTSAFSQLLTKRCGSVPNMIVNNPLISKYYFSESERLSNKISLLWNKPDFSGYEIQNFIIQINVDVFGRWLNSIEYTLDLSLNSLSFNTFNDLVIPVSAHEEGEPNNYRYDIQNIEYRTPELAQDYTIQTGIHVNQYGSLINGNKYYLRITSENELGIANYSSVLTGIPITRPENSPAVCIGSKTVIGDQLVYLTWKIPNDDGGAPILNYIIDYQEYVNTTDSLGNTKIKLVGKKYRYNQNAEEPTTPNYPKDDFVAVYNTLKNRSTLTTAQLNSVYAIRDNLLKFVIPPTPIILVDPDKNLASVPEPIQNVVLTYDNPSFTYISDELTQNVFDISNIQLKWYYFQDNTGTEWNDDTNITFRMSIRGSLEHVDNSAYDISNIFYIPDSTQYTITKSKLSIFGTYSYIDYTNGNIISNLANIPKIMVSSLPRIDAYKEKTRYKLKIVYTITSFSSNVYKFIMYSGTIQINGTAPVRTNPTLETTFTMKLSHNDLSPLDNKKKYQFTITPFNIADYFPTSMNNTTEIVMGIDTALPIENPSYSIVVEQNGGKINMRWNYGPSVKYYIIVDIPSSYQNSAYPNEYPTIAQSDLTTRSIETPNLTPVNQVVSYSIPSTDTRDIQSGYAQTYLRPGRAYTITVAPIKSAEINGININLVAPETSITPTFTYIVPFVAPLRPISLSALGYNSAILLSWKLPNLLDDPNYYITDDVSPFYTYRYYSLEMRNITSTGIWIILSDRISIPSNATVGSTMSYNVSTGLINENQYQFRVQMLIQNEFNSQIAVSEYTYITQVNTTNIPENSANTIYPSQYPYKPSGITRVMATRGAGIRVLYIELNQPVYTGNATEYECFIEYSADNSITWTNIFHAANGIANISDNSDILNATTNTLMIPASSGAFYSVSIRCKGAVLAYNIRVRFLGKITGVAEPYPNPNLSYTDNSDVVSIIL